MSFLFINSTDYGKSFHDISHRINHTFIKEELGISVGPGSSVTKSNFILLLVEAEERGDLVLKRTKDFGKTFTIIHEDVFSFGYIGAFLFFSVMEDPVRRKDSTLSHSAGVLQLPSLGFYSILDGDEDMLFMHVDNPGDTFFGTMYTSDDRGILFSKSLERHLFDGHRKSDFTNITSLRGVYLTNKLDIDGRIRSVISFNRGGTWRQLKKPQNVNCADNVKRSTVVETEYLRGPHHYSILDSGGLIVAVEVHREGEVKTIKFSTDEGQCWKSYNFTEQPFFFAGLASEPGTKAMNVSVWGFRPEEDGQPMWVAVTIDFQSLITRECNKKDYEEWLAHSTDKKNSERNGCVLGMKETYRRLKKQSVCRNGRNFVVTKKQIPCPCTREDYLCDYGYYRHVNTSECVRRPSTPNKTFEMCLNGEEDELLTAGYRKVPSDKCQGGFTPQDVVQTIIRPCGVKPSPDPSVKSTSVGHFDTPVRIVLMLKCLFVLIRVL
uniref:Si:dkey-159a18.1 n=1 Tax=Poecilia reticulata TaxID=8081 RepID=A0A3P9MZJ7_POERE